MPSINLPYINIALDAFALIVVLVILAACCRELFIEKSGSGHFLLLLLFVTLTLGADIVSWAGEGHPRLSVMTLVANTVTSCSSHLAILCFMGYLKDSLYANSRAAKAILYCFRVLCVCCVCLILGNIFGEYLYFVNQEGHCVSNDTAALRFLPLLFPLLSFFVIVLMALLAKKTTKVNRFIFLLYTVFPVVGVVIDHHFHGFSLAYIGLVISVLIIYTNIYLQKQALIDSQRNALMLSQINPHFVYNTLSTIASMCDISPKQAKYLTIDFSRYLRKNLDTLTREEQIPFEQELEHVECYLKIEKARFGDRLNILYAISCKDFSIPPLSVQPLVENAVRHGITKKAEGGTVKISTFCTEKAYIIEIKDDGVGFDAEAPKQDQKTHIGLENVKNRIASMCHGTVSIKSTVGVGTRVTIEIPKKKGKRYEHSGG